MVDVYLSVSDIENYLNVTYSTEQATRMQRFIDIGTKAFENEVGSYRENPSTNILKPSRNGLLLTNVPTDDPIVFISNGDKITPTYTELPTGDYGLDPNFNKLMLIREPILGRSYKVTYNTGYAYEDMPEDIKYLVFLYTMLMSFETATINNEGLDVTKEIDVDVYRQITKGNPYNGFGALTKMIEDRKKQLTTKGNLTTYNGSYKY